MTTEGCKGVYRNGKRTGCGKMPEDGSLLCPRCIVLSNVHVPKTAANRIAAQDQSRKQEERNAARIEKAKRDAEFLAVSPLRADNPEYGKRRIDLRAPWLREHAAGDR